VNRNLAGLLFSICCKREWVSLNKLPDTPPEMQHLLDPDTREGRCQFIPNVRPYNSVLSMSSQGANVEPAVAGGVQNFSMDGQVCHKMGPLLLDHPRGYTPRLAHLYIIDNT